MALVTMQCPNCGQSLTPHTQKDWFFCEYCGTKIANVAQKIEYSGTVNINTDAQVRNLVYRGYQFLSQNNLRNAFSYFNSALDVDARHIASINGSKVYQAWTCDSLYDARTLLQEVVSTEPDNEFACNRLQEVEKSIVRYEAEYERKMSEANREIARNEQLIHKCKLRKTIFLPIMIVGAVLLLISFFLLGSNSNAAGTVLMIIGIPSFVVGLIVFGMASSETTRLRYRVQEIQRKMKDY